MVTEQMMDHRIDTLTDLRLLPIDEIKLRPRFIAWIAGVSIAIVGLFLVSRRIMAGMKEPLPIAALLLVGILLAIVVLTLRRLLQMPNRRVAGKTEHPVAFVIAIAGCVLVAFAISLRGSGYVGLAFLWLPLLLSILQPRDAMNILKSQGLLDSTTLAQANVHVSNATSESTETTSTDLESPSTIKTRCDSSVAGPFVTALMNPDALLEDESAFDDSIQQFQVRSIDEDGSTVVFARLRARIEPGDRTANLHLAFCPPLANDPQVSVEQVDGPEAQVVVGQANYVGVRIDIRLPRPAESSRDVVVELYSKAK